DASWCVTAPSSRCVSRRVRWRKLMGDGCDHRHVVVSTPRSSRGGRIDVSMIRSLPVRDVIVFVASLVAIAAVTAWLRAIPDISSTTVALALLLVVLGTATLARLRIATVVSVLAMLTLNFFFLPPVGTFTIAHPQNWIALFAFLVVAVIASNLSAAAQDRAREAIARRNEMTRLFDLTRDVLLTTDRATAIDALARHVARRFELSRTAIC